MVLEADQPAVISRVIEAFPKPKEENIKWHFETPTGLVTLNPGKSHRRLSASPIRDLGSNAYEVEYRINKALPLDDGKTLNLEVQVGLATHTIDIPLKVPPPGTDRPPFKPSPPEEMGPKETTAPPSAGKMMESKITVDCSKAKALCSGHVSLSQLILGTRSNEFLSATRFAKS